MKSNNLNSRSSEQKYHELKCNGVDELEANWGYQKTTH